MQEPFVDSESCQPPSNDYISDPAVRREKIGNNRKKINGLAVKRKRKLAAISRKKNRGK